MATLTMPNPPTRAEVEQVADDLEFYAYAARSMGHAWGHGAGDLMSKSADTLRALLDATEQLQRERDNNADAAERLSRTANLHEQAWRDADAALRATRVAKEAAERALLRHGGHVRGCPAAGTAFAHACDESTCGWATLRNKLKGSGQ